MAEKKAIQRLVKDDTGRVRVILIDLETLQPVTDPSQYKIISANTPIEMVLSVDEPDPQPVRQPPTTELPSTEVSPFTNDTASATPTPGISDGNTGASGFSKTNNSLGNFPEAPSMPGTRQNTLDFGNNQVNKANTPSKTGSVFDRIGPKYDAPTTPGPTGPTGTRENSNTPGVGFFGNFEGKIRDQTPSQGFIDTVTGAVGNTRGLGQGYSVRGESGQGPYGSHRHRSEDGVAMDFDVVDAQGRTVTDTNKLNDLAAQYAFENSNAGIGFGQGYMSPGRMHLDLANDPAAWGAGGKGANMSPALRETIEAARAGFQPTPFDNAPSPFSRDENKSPTSYNPVTGNVDNPDRTKDDRIDPSYNSPGLSNVAASSIDAMGNARAGTVSNMSNVSVTGKPGVTTIDDGYTTVDRYGDRNARNNNPGNIRSGAFADAFGAIGKDREKGGFAVFDDPETGKAAMAGLLFDTKAYKDLDIASAISRYAPPEENNTKQYIDTVSQSLGLPATTPMSSLNPEQRAQMVDVMTDIEGRSGVRESRNEHTYSGPPSTGDKDSPSEKSGGRFGGSGLGERGPSHSEERGRDTSLGGGDRGGFGKGGVSNHSAERERDTSLGGDRGGSNSGGGNYSGRNDGANSPGDTAKGGGFGGGSSSGGGKGKGESGNTKGGAGGGGTKADKDHSSGGSRTE